MKLVKFNKTNLILKLVLTIILFFGGFSVSLAQENNNNNKEKKEITSKKEAATKARQSTIIPVTGETDVRDILLDPADEEAMILEEERRLRMEAELEEDEAKIRIIKRTFGSSLFSNTYFDINQAINIPTPGNYVLAAGDKLEINVYGTLNSNQTVTVDPDGFIVLTKGGIVNVLGTNIGDAESKIRAALARVYPSVSMGAARVRVALSGFRTIKIRVQGQVVAPGTYTTTSFADLMIAMHLSGGPNEIGTYRDIKLIRNNKVIANLDIYDYIVNGFSEDNILLKDQDIVQVGPYESRVAVSGQTKVTGLFEIKSDDKIADLLRYAGGFNQNAYADLIKVYRNTRNERKILNIKNEDFNNERVFTGDSVVVEKVLDRIGNLVTIEGSVYRDGEYSLDYNPSLSKLIESAGGLREESLEGRINIFRTNDDLSVSNLSVNYYDILNKNQADIKLKRFDRVIVPSIFELTEQSVIRIRGAINNPDAKIGVEIPYVKDMTIQDVLVHVGGLTEAASLSGVEIVRRKRNIDPKVSDAQIADIKTFRIRPDLSLVNEHETIVLLPFDEIIVRNSPNYETQKFVTISGEVLYPGEFGIEYKDQKISDIISRAGGLTDLAYLKGAKLFRKILLSEQQRKKREETMINFNISRNIKMAKDLLGEEDEEEDEAKTTSEGVEADSYIIDEIGLDFEKILKNPGNLKYDMILEDGDEIVIPKRLETVRIEGEILYPNSVKYIPGKNFLSYITEAGGFTKMSARGNAIVVYPNGSVDRTRKFLFFKFYPKIEPGSEIIVPGKTTTGLEQFGQASGVITTLSTTLMTVLSIMTILRFN